MLAVQRVSPSPPSPGLLARSHGQGSAQGPGLLCTGTPLQPPSSSAASGAETLSVGFVTRFHHISCFFTNESWSNVIQIKSTQGTRADFSWASRSDRMPCQPQYVLPIDCVCGVFLQLFVFSSRVFAGVWSTRLHCMNLQGLISMQ